MDVPPSADSGMTAFERCVEDIITKNPLYPTNGQPVQMIGGVPDPSQYIMPCPQSDYNGSKMAPEVVPNTLIYYPNPTQAAPNYQPPYGYYPHIGTAQDGNMSIAAMSHAPFYVAPPSAPMYSTVPSTSTAPIFGYATTIPCACNTPSCRGVQMAFIPSTTAPLPPYSSEQPLLRPHQGVCTPQTSAPHSRSSTNILSISTPQTKPLITSKSERGSIVRDGEFRRRLFPHSGKASPPLSLDDSTASTEAKKHGNVSNILYKTELCKDHEKSGRCPRGNACQFAHGLGEVHDPRSHPLYKTAYCHDFKESKKCPRGDQCFHVHHSQEMRKKPSRLPSVGQEDSSGPKRGDSSSSSASDLASVSSLAIGGESAVVVKETKQISGEDVDNCNKKKRIWKQLMTNPGISQSEVYMPVTSDGTF